jgi:prevent-host-death family protein
MNVLNDICPISDFRDNASSMVAKVRSDHRPLIITQYGKSSAVLISAEAYQELLDRIEILSDIAASEEEIANGGGMDQEEFKKELFKKIRQ